MAVVGRQKARLQRPSAAGVGAVRVEGIFDLPTDLFPAVDAVCVDGQDVDTVPGAGGHLGRHAGSVQPKGQVGMPQVAGAAGERRVIISRQAQRTCRNR